MAARMIPSLGPSEHDARSREGEIYYALSKLPDDFTVSTRTEYWKSLTETH